MLLEKTASNELLVEELSALGRRLDSVSPTFCLAKWYQVTLSLHNGRSASCCLQDSRPIPLDELEDDPSKLHNGEGHIEDRRRLLEGLEVSGCSSCLEAEKRGDFSERHFKSGDHWALSMMEKARGDVEQSRPTYVEVSFSHECQMRCCYCNSKTSSSIQKEIEEYGPYPDSETGVSLNKAVSKEPFVKAFWRWLPDLYEELKVLRLTGGEPFLSEDTFSFLDYLKRNPGKMDIEFNTNLSFPSSILKRFIHAFRSIPRGHYREVTFFVSVDCLGEAAEYIRFGMKETVIKANIETLFQAFPNINITITATVNALAVSSFHELVLYVEELKNKRGKNKVQLSSYPLIFPHFQSVELLREKGLADLKKQRPMSI